MHDILHILLCKYTPCYGLFTRQIAISFDTWFGACKLQIPIQIWLYLGTERGPNGKLMFKIYDTLKCNVTNIKQNACWMYEFHFPMSMHIARHMSFPMSYIADVPVFSFYHPLQLTPSCQSTCVLSWVKYPLNLTIAHNPFIVQSLLKIWKVSSFLYIILFFISNMILFQHIWAVQSWSTRTTT